MELYYTLVFFIFGTIFGSFYNVVGTRLPEGQSIINPPSHCSNCNHQLGFWELFPIISYIFLGGKCKNCKTHISIIHPLFELLTGILFALIYNIYGWSIELLIALIFVSSLLIVVISDFSYMIIPDEVLIVSIVLLIIVMLISKGFETTILAIFNALVAFGLMLLLKLVGDFIFKRESLGGGDIKLLFLFGLVLGWPNALITIFLGALIGLPIALVMTIKSSDNVVPFGPFLSIAAMILFLTNFNFNTFIEFLMKL